MVFSKIVGAFMMASGILIIVPTLADLIFIPMLGVSIRAMLGLSFLHSLLLSAAAYYGLGIFLIVAGWILLHF